MFHVLDCKTNNNDSAANK